MRFAAIALAAAWIGHAAPVRADQASDAFVARINAAVGGLDAGDAAGVRKACGRLVATAFDIAAMAPSISAGTWQKLNAAQRRRLLEGLTSRVERDCRSRGRDFAGKTMGVVGERTGDGGDRFIAVKATEGGGRTLIWRVRQGSGGLRAVDITVDGRSLVVTVEKDAKALLQKAGGDLQQFVISMGG